MTGNRLPQPGGKIYDGGLSFVKNEPVYLHGSNCAAVLQGLGFLQPGQECPGGRAINPNAFEVVDSGYGDTPRNFARGFGAWQMDLAVRREFPIHERLKLQLRAEAFNVFNHPNFGSVDGFCGGTPGVPGCTFAQFGQATATLANSLGVLSPLYQMVACHDLGYARDEQGRLMFDVPELCLWGRGYRLDEIRGAVLRVQLKKMTQIVERMRSSKYKIRESLQSLSGLKLRRVVDPAGDTGALLITTYESPTIAQQVNAALRAEGITTFPQGMSNIRMTDWGLHLYYNIVSLVAKRSIDKQGFPWNLVENKNSEIRYEKGTCPVADSLFERSIIMSIPSCLSSQDEEDTIHAFKKVMSNLKALAAQETAEITG